MSHADKRSVATDALETLGTILENQEERDAIHLAVECVITAHDMYPGQDIGLLPDGRASTHVEKHLGIADPFIKEDIIPAGSRIWLVVYPRQIKSLRHVWEHPDFPASRDLAPPAEEPFDGSFQALSLVWMTNYVDQLNKTIAREEEHYSLLTLDELMQTAESWLEDDKGGESCWGIHICKGGAFEGESLHPEFWHHWSVLTGKVPPSDKPSFFTCSC